jgi:hypothetical protein
VKDDLAQRLVRPLVIGGATPEGWTLARVRFDATLRRIVYTIVPPPLEIVVEPRAENVAHCAQTTNFNLWVTSDRQTTLGLDAQRMLQAFVDLVRRNDEGGAAVSPLADESPEAEPAAAPTTTQRDATHARPFISFRDTSPIRATSDIEPWISCASSRTYSSRTASGTPQSGF